MIGHFGFDWYECKAKVDIKQNNSNPELAFIVICYSQQVDFSRFLPFHLAGLKNNFTFVALQNEVM
jgi:hypothetical protein